MVPLISRTTQKPQYEKSIQLQAPLTKSESEPDDDLVAMALVEKFAERAWHDTDDDMA